MAAMKMPSRRRAHYLLLTALLLIAGVTLVSCQDDQQQLGKACGVGGDEECSPEGTGDASVDDDQDEEETSDEGDPMHAEGEEGGDEDSSEDDDDDTEDSGEEEDESDAPSKKKKPAVSNDDDTDEYNTYYTVDGPVLIGTDDEGPTDLECGLYMAESAIPFAGWGMYTGISLTAGQTMQPTDTCIQVNDQVTYMNRLRKSKASIPVGGKKELNNPNDLPTWLMEQYYWNARVANADWDARSIDTIIPAFGMLANSHTGLVNLDNRGPQRMEKVAVMSEDDDDDDDNDAMDHNKKIGAYTTYRDQSFIVTKNLPVGHELFADYGDEWFREREHVFGPIPLSKDFKEADKALKQFVRICNGTLESEFCKDLWNLVRDESIVEQAAPDRLMKALPETLEDVSKILSHEKKQGDKQPSKHGSTAYHSLPNVIRTIPWLQENGMCLDHMKAAESTIPNAGMGAFSRRALPQGTLLTPAPLIHMHRNHLVTLTTDSASGEILWKGHQLLLNYCYSHPSSSLIFFPYSPVINFINHAPATTQTEGGPTANVGMRWSSRMKHTEWLHLSTEELLDENLHAGLMMELYTLRVIEEDEELFMDYGPAWQEAWDTFEPPATVLESSRAKEAHEIEDRKVLPTEREKKNALPSNVMTICWVDTDNMEETDEKNVFVWSKTRTKYVDEANTCFITKRIAPAGEPAKYDVRYKVDKNEFVNVKNLPRRAIKIVDKEYTKSQYLRGTFRHEIHMPDDMIPTQWRDLEEYREECGLYMAESAIPFAGLGMYTAIPIADKQRVFYGDTVVQIADYKLNRKLRHWHHGTDKDEEPDWLLDNYYWQSDNTLGEFETDKVYSIVPGMGMLANSHTGLINSDMRRPSRDSGGMHRSTHPSAGASTTYHDVNFIAAYGDIEAGSELFVEYGDNWFEYREKELGVIPLSDDFPEADKMLQEFYSLVGEDVESEMAKDLWGLLWNTSSTEEDSRIRNALPRSLEDVPAVIESGTAKNSVPNRIRPIEWLEENGICIDNIKPGKSTIPGAHNGAFATRPMKKGEIIAPAPVVHIRREHLEIYDSDDPKNKKKEVWFEGHQLILNYCYGHANSSVLLYPYAPVVNYINHDSRKFNAELRWSSLSAQDQSLKEQDVDTLMKHDHAGLIMEFVATRDIAVGEEIFINYGDEWENEWNEWTQEWTLDPETPEYTPAYEVDDYLQPIRTEVEQKDNPYPKNAKTVCFIDTEKEPLEEKGEKGEPIYNFKYIRSLYETSDDGYPCDILQRHGKKDYSVLKNTIAPPALTYTVRIYKPKKKKLIIRKVPRRAIQFFDEEYTSDLSLTNVFRHAIGLPDHMLPPAWADYTIDKDEEE